MRNEWTVAASAEAEARKFASPLFASSSSSNNHPFLGPSGWEGEDEDAFKDFFFSASSVG